MSDHKTAGDYIEDFERGRQGQYTGPDPANQQGLDEYDKNNPPWSGHGSKGGGGNSEAMSFAATTILYGPGYLLLLPVFTRLNGWLHKGSKQWSLHFAIAGAIVGAVIAFTPIGQSAATWLSGALDISPLSSQLVVLLSLALLCFVAGYQLLYRLNEILDALEPLLSFVVTFCLYAAVSYLAYRIYRDGFGGEPIRWLEKLGDKALGWLA